jgi:hypothetical protein
MAPPDSFMRIAAGRAAFRMVDLQRLVSAVDHLAASMEADNA